MRIIELNTSKLPIVHVHPVVKRFAMVLYARGRCSASSKYTRTQSWSDFLTSESTRSMRFSTPHPVIANSFMGVGSTGCTQLGFCEGTSALNYLISQNNKAQKLFGGGDTLQVRHSRETISCNSHIRHVSGISVYPQCSYVHIWLLLENYIRSKVILKSQKQSPYAQSVDMVLNLNAFTSNESSKKNCTNANIGRFWSLCLTSAS